MKINTAYQNVCSLKEVLRQIFIVSNAYSIRKKYLKEQPKLAPQQAQKRKPSKTKVKEENANQQNEKQKTIETINHMESCLFKRSIKLITLQLD